MNPSSASSSTRCTAALGSASSLALWPTWTAPSSYNARCSMVRFARMINATSAPSDSSSESSIAFSEWRLGIPRIQWGAPPSSTAQEARDDLETWEAWLKRYFPAHVSQEFAEHHRQLWQWVWAIGVELLPLRGAVPITGDGVGPPRQGEPLDQQE